MSVAGVSWTAVVRNHRKHYERQHSTVRRRRISIWLLHLHPTEHLSGIAYHCHCQREICGYVLLYIVYNKIFWEYFFTLWNGSNSFDFDQIHVIKLNLISRKLAVKILLYQLLWSDMLSFALMYLQWRVVSVYTSSHTDIFQCCVVQHVTFIYRFSDRSFTVVGPRLWNSLFTTLQQMSSYGIIIYRVAELKSGQLNIFAGNIILATFECIGKIQCFLANVITV